MERNRQSDGKLITGGQSFDYLDSQGSFQFNEGLNNEFYPQSTQFLDVLPFIEKPCERGKKLTSDNIVVNLGEESSDGCYDRENGGELPWQRVKWTDKMVKLMIDVLYYVEEDAAAGCLGGVKRKPSMLQKTGKWRCVSNLMVERGHRVSPQQCEDKFNDLNKKYKRLNDVLGRGTCCSVVENPELLDVVNVSKEVKEEVKKTLSSKNLFYREMCSYHTRNSLHLPRDPELRRSLQLALGGREENKLNQSRQYNGDDGFEEEQQDAGADGQFEETGNKRGNPGFCEPSSSRSKQTNERKDVTIGNPLKTKDYGKSSGAAKQNDPLHVNHVHPNDRNADRLQKQWMAFRLRQLKERKLQIKALTLDLEKQKINWQRKNFEEDRALDKMRLENECMKLENERLAFELKKKKMRSS